MSKFIFILAIVQVLNAGDTKFSLPNNLNIPSKNDEIVIIGGGPSGVDMAARLKNLGYLNLRILEKNDEVGGKSQTRVRDGIAYDMGTVILLPRNSYKNMVDLLEKYDMDSRRPNVFTSTLYDASASCVVAQFAQGCEKLSLTTGELVIGSAIAQKPEIIDGVPQDEIPSYVVGLVIQTLNKYNKIHDQIFGSYDFSFPPRPSNLTLFAMTADEFIEENDLQIIRTILKLLQTGYGYGYLDELPAYYLLHLVDPEFINYYIGRISQTLDMNNPDENISILRNGFQPLWQQIVNVEKIQVETSFDVSKISRTGQKIMIFGQQNGKPKEIEADYIFIAIPLPLSLLENPSSQELEVLDNISTSTFTSTLLQGWGFSGDATTIHSINNANQTGEMTQEIWWVWFREGQLMSPSEKFGAAIDNRTVISLQYHYNRGNDSDFSDIALDTIFNGGLDELSTGSPEVEEVFEQIVFDDYFPRYSNQQLKEGGHWRFLGIQGNQNTIFLGSLPSGMDTTESVVSYNKMIAEKIGEQLQKIPDISQP